MQEQETSHRRKRPNPPEISLAFEYTLHYSNNHITESLNEKLRPTPARTVPVPINILCFAPIFVFLPLSIQESRKPHPTPSAANNPKPIAPACKGNAPAPTASLHLKRYSFPAGTSHLSTSRLSIVPRFRPGFFSESCLVKASTGLNGGDSAYVPTTTFYSVVFDKAVQLLAGTGVSAFLLDARGVGVSYNEIKPGVVGLRRRRACWARMSRCCLMGLWLRWQCGR
ncbi:hypothetical protein CC80DRAFT_505611 [Byssothecium circinans]|uniref:Uncharacterized protein n=1 Tax=Byssothecium circinans TaxID=147558 RepID=A0A6A5TRE9_9PLEO|nr:hypothetical protein CC80DRAFT_505611 [Byssothecium circinans]